MSGAAGGATGAAAVAAAEARRRLVAGAVRVRVRPDVFESIVARAGGPVVRVGSVFGTTWWVIADGFAFRTRSGNVSLPDATEVIDAQSAE